MLDARARALAASRLPTRLAHKCLLTQLLGYRVARGWAQREQRGVYRFTGVPPTEARTTLIALHLWSDEQGTFSHVTALALHGLSDALPAKIHMTVPTTWRLDRFARPKTLVLHPADLPEADIQWVGHIRVTKPARTLADCIAAKVSPTLVEQGLAQARSRKLITTAEHARLRRADEGSRR